VSDGARHVFVTGATGFVGRQVVPLLLAAGCRVTAISRDPAGVRSLPGGSAVAVIEADPFAADVRFPRQPGAVLVHLAWPHLDDYRNPAHFLEALPASRRLILAAVAAGVTQVSVAGTCLEYGLVHGEVQVEHPCAPTTAYGLAKLQLLQQLEMLLGDAPEARLQWLRLFYLHGPGQPARTLMGQLEAAIARGDACFPMSLGEQLRDYLDVREAAADLVTLVQSGRAGRFHVCSGRPISVRRLVETRLRAAGVRMELELGRHPLAPHEALAFWGRPSLPRAAREETEGP
jgi:dTDP-6-deoxy-L-talose 4-dehydrogenase (NAD+)